VQLQTGLRRQPWRLLFLDRKNNFTGELNINWQAWYALDKGTRNTNRVTAGC
jgi:hypothetical protein